MAFRTILDAPKIPGEGAGSFTFVTAERPRPIKGVLAIATSALV